MAIGILGDYGYGQDRYPQWLYGPGGKPVEKPFGEDPERAQRPNYSDKQNAAQPYLAERRYEWLERRDEIMQQNKSATPSE